MVALLNALIPLLQAIIAGGGLRTVLSAVTVSQWEEIATQLIQVGPSVTAELPKIFGQLLPSIQPPLQNMTQTLSATNDPKAAANSVQSWIAANNDALIKEYPETED